MKSWVAFALGGLLAAVIATALYQRKIASQPEVASTAPQAVVQPVPLPEQPLPAALDPPPASAPPAAAAGKALVAPKNAPRTPQNPIVSSSPAAQSPAAQNAPPAPEPITPVAPAVKEPPMPPPPPPRVAKTVTLTEGTLIGVRLAEKVSSETHQPGDSFTGTLDQPLVVEGLVLAERGSRVEGKIVETKQAGRVKGVSYLSLALTRFNTADGQRVNVQTAAFEKEGPKETGRDAAKVGIASGIGAAIGAIAGGGKGAGIGAATGAGVGTGAVLATRGKAAELPVETRITFRLAAPVSVTEKLQ